jgi:hypothetical protein
MIKKHYKGITAAFLAVMLGTSGALAGVCQVTSNRWATDLFCGVQSRGFAHGSNNTFGLGQRGIGVVSTGIPGGFSSVAAQGLNSAGQQIAGCGVVDTVEDGSDIDHNGVWAIGGACQQGVRYILQVTF